MTNMSAGMHVCMPLFQREIWTRGSRSCCIYACAHAYTHTRMDVPSDICFSQNHAHTLQDIELREHAHNPLHTYIHTYTHAHMAGHWAPWARSQPFQPTSSAASSTWMRRECPTYIHTYMHTYMHCVSAIQDDTWCPAYIYTLCFSNARCIVPCIHTHIVLFSNALWVFWHTIRASTRAQSCGHDHNTMCFNSGEKQACVCAEYIFLRFSSGVFCFCTLTQKRTNKQGCDEEPCAYLDPASRLQRNHQPQNPVSIFWGSCQ